MRKWILVFLPLLVMLEGACSRGSRYYLDKGNKFASEGKYADAELNYRKAIQKDAGSGEAFYQLGLAEISLRRPQEAFQALGRANQLLPNRDDIKTKFADFCWALYTSDQRNPQALFDRVTIISDQLLTKNPKSFDGFRLKGLLAMASKRYVEAENDYKTANTLKPMQPELILGWAETLFLDDKPQEAETLATQLIEKNKTYQPIYDLLYLHYIQAKDQVNAEKILKTKFANNPENAASALELAAFYSSASREADMKAILQQMLANPKAFPQARLQVGDLYSRLRRWNDAFAQYDAGAKAATGKEKLVYLKRTTDVWLAQGKPEQAGQEVDQILKEEPGDPAANAVKASLLLATRKPENIAKAVAQLQPVVEKNPDNASLRFTLGRALAAKGDLDGARTQFQEAIKRQRNYLEPRLALIELSQAKKDYPAMLQYSSDALAINPNLSAIRLIHAVALINTRNDVQGRKELDILAKAYPQNREVLLQLAMVALRDKKFKDAEEQFRKLAQVNSNDLRPMQGLVETLAAENQLDRAVGLLQDEVKRSPQNNQVRYLLAYTAQLDGKYDVAMERYQELLRAAPNSPQLYVALGTTYRFKKDYASALSQYQKAASLAPNDAAPLVAMADVMDVSGRKAEALANYRRALKLKPDNAVIMNNTAYLIAETGGSTEEALKLAQKAVQLDSKQPRFNDTLGWVYLKKNLPDSALQVFRALTTKYPEDAMFHYHLGMALLQKGDPATAKSELKDALSKNPSAEVRQNVEVALAKIG